jgi:hypothetical protein
MSDLPMHLWEMPTAWFPKPDTEYINCTYNYKSWKDFRECKPYKLWKPYILSSWSWKLRKEESMGMKKPEKRRDGEKHTMDCTTMLRVNASSYDKQRGLHPTNQGDEVDMLQIVFISPDRFVGMHRVEMRVSRDDEEEVRLWLKNHMPNFWKL